MSFAREEGTIRRRWVALFAAVVVCAYGLMGPVLIALISRHVSVIPAFGAMAGYVGMLAGLAVLWQRLWRVSRGRLTADTRGLFLNGKLVAARAKLQHAYVFEENGRMFLRLVRPGMVVRPIDVEVENAEEAQELLAALRLDAQSSVVEFAFTAGTPKSDGRQVGGIALTFAVTLALSMFLFFMRIEPENMLIVRPLALLLYVLTSGGALYALKTRRVEVSVGADGVTLRQLLRAPRFIAFRELTDISLDGVNITFRLADGSVVNVHHLGEGRPKVAHDREREGAALVSRVREALDAYRAAPAGTAHAFARGQRTAGEWMRHTRAMREDTAGYRAAAVPDEQLWKIVEDASASPTERAGAALALRRDLDDQGRTRLRLAAEACAETRLRVALQSATVEDDEALAAALEPLEDAMPARRMAL